MGTRKKSKEAKKDVTYVRKRKSLNEVDRESGINASNSSTQTKKNNG